MGAATIRQFLSGLARRAWSLPPAAGVLLVLAASLRLALIDRDFTSLPALIVILGPPLLAGMWVNVAIQDYLDSTGFVDPGVFTGLAGLEAVLRGGPTPEAQRLRSRALRRMAFFVIGLPPLWVAWLYVAQQIYALVLGH